MKITAQAYFNAAPHMFGLRCGALSIIALLVSLTLLTAFSAEPFSWGEPGLDKLQMIPYSAKIGSISETEMRAGSQSQQTILIM